MNICEEMLTDAVCQWRRK